ncbi:MAG: molecular chaperone HtpG [Bacteroidaceae bacterium]|nr:molecular chaperone HtpG [Bacteroidaceae bacterium]
MKTGNIGVTTENIFPIIKKFLYSDHEIFLRELVSNAVDATQKLKTYAMKGDFKGELGDLTVHVSLDKEAGTITISDRGIGMTAEEIDKYINQIAFSGANDFLEKYKNDANAIIGHFGLGFYSAFMVAKSVDIVTRSYREEAQAVKWSCDGSPEFTLEEVEKADRGTDIILHIDDDCKEFLEESRLSALLTKYCRFLPISIAFGKKKDWKDGKQVETDEDNIINDTTPLWTRTPSELTDEDYKKFYRDLYPMSDEPLFWIHLNVDYPFNLTGVLYFPKIKSNIDLQKNKIQLYCNQVYVTDSVEGIVPDFLTLLHGVIDSPDIPLNVSRSYLQSDSNVKKISTYITKKVADRLNGIFKDNRKEFEEKWNDLKLFINYGMLTEESFYDKAKQFALFTDTEGKHFTYEEYKELIKGEQTDKEGNLIYLYATDRDEQYTYIEAAQQKGYNVLLFDGQLDTAMLNLYEQKFEKSRFSRVDADIIDNLIVKEDKQRVELPAEEKEMLTAAFKSQMPEVKKTEFHVDAQPLGNSSAPIIITQSEYMRRMKEMAAINAGMSFYGEMPDMYTLILNTDHPLIQSVLTAEKEQTADSLRPINEETATLKAREEALEASHKGMKDEEIPSAEKDELSDLHTKIHEQSHKREAIFADFAKDNNVLHQLIDLALLQNGMLKGEALSRFIKRSVEMI